MHPEIMGAIIGASTSVGMGALILLGRALILVVRNGRNGHGGALKALEAGPPHRHCPEHDALVNNVTEIRTNVEWLCRQAGKEE